MSSVPYFKFPPSPLLHCHHLLGLFALLHIQSLEQNLVQLTLCSFLLATNLVPWATCLWQFLSLLACLPFFESCSGLPSLFPLFPFLVTQLPTPSHRVQTSLLNSYIIFADCCAPMPLTTPNPAFPVPHNLPHTPSVIILCSSAVPGAF